MISVALSDFEEWRCSADAGRWAIFPAIEAAASPRPLGPFATQLAVCRVDDAAVVLIAAELPRLPPDAWRSLAAAAREKFDGAAVLVVLKAEPGRLSVDTSFCDRDEARRALAFELAAIVQASWGWDGSERIRIDSSHGSVEVEPRFDGQRWKATLVSQ
jgi:hypothetical protein